MTASVYKIHYTLNGTDWTEIEGIQEINAFIGKTSFIDPVSPSRMSFTAWYPEGFSSPNTALVTGTEVRLTRVGATYEMWFGYIADVEVEYGIPYDSDSSIGVSDYVTVTCEGALAEWGRYPGGGTEISSANPFWSLAQIHSASGISIGTTYTSDDTTMLAASTVDNSWADWLNVFAQTLGATIKDGGGIVGVYTKDFTGTLGACFSDEANDATHQVYSQIAFTSEVENYFTQVRLETNAYGAVTVEADGASAPYRTLTLDTFSGSVDHATEMANFYLNMYKTPSLGIKQLVARSEAQNVWHLDLGYGWWDILGYRTTVEFRGTSHYMSIIGCSFQATPETSTFTYYLTDWDYLRYLKLGDAFYGRLGFGILH